MRQATTLRFVCALLLALSLLQSCTKDPVAAPPGKETVAPFPTSIGQPLGSAVSKQIDAAGGTVSSADGRVTLTIPAGALAANTTISIQPIENTAPNGIGQSYDFLPNGQQFAKPITVTLHYTDAEMAGTAPELLQFGYQNSQNAWAGKDNLQVNKAAHTISAPIKHFSRWAFYAMFRLNPTEATLTTGETVTLHAVKLPYSEDPDPTDGPAEWINVLGHPTPVPATDISNWQVNGQPATTNSANGWLTDGSEGAKVYHAPSQVPAVNPVAVSCSLRTGQGTISLLSNITVVPKITPEAPNSYSFTDNGTNYTNLQGTFSVRHRPARSN